MNSSHPAPVSGPLFCADSASLPWVRWGFRGARFKLLSAEPEGERFTILMHIEAGTTAPRHRHLGAVEAFVLEGSFYYLEQPEQVFKVGGYLVEQDGSVHQPTSPEGVVMLATFYGPVQGLDENGQVTGAIDRQWHVDAWRAALESDRG